MFTLQNGDNQLDKIFGIQIGLGWFIAPRFSSLVVSHGGDLPGFHSMLIIISEQYIGVFISANSDSGIMAVREIAAKAPEEDLFPVEWSEDQLL